MQFCNVDNDAQTLNYGTPLSRDEVKRRFPHEGGTSNGGMILIDDKIVSIKCNLRNKNYMNAVFVKNQRPTLAFEESAHTQYNEEMRRIWKEIEPVPVHLIHENRWGDF